MNHFKSRQFKGKTILWAVLGIVPRASCFVRPTGLRLKINMALTTDEREEMLEEHGIKRRFTVGFCIIPRNSRNF